MSTTSLATGSGSSGTLARGCELASTPLNNLLCIKNEPVDNEELEIRAQMQAGYPGILMPLLMLSGTDSDP